VAVGETLMLLPVQRKGVDLSACCRAIARVDHRRVHAGIILLRKDQGGEKAE